MNEETDKDEAAHSHAEHCSPEEKIKQQKQLANDLKTIRGVFKKSLTMQVQFSKMLQK